jgi:predicted dehydrogenase
VEVTGIASRTPQKAEEFAARHGIQHAFGSYEALLRSTDINAVYVALPTGIHCEWARRALEAGKHVLCEKSLAENVQQAESLFQLAAQHRLVLVEAMHIRYLERLRRQREFVAGGKLGRLICIESSFRSPFVRFSEDDFRLRREFGGGAALDVGRYAVSGLRYVSGRLNRGRQEPRIPNSKTPSAVDAASKRTRLSARVFVKLAAIWHSNSPLPSPTKLRQNQPTFRSRPTAFSPRRRRAPLGTDL